MSRLTAIFKSIGTNPLLAIELILSVGLLAYGVYIIGPWYVHASNTVLGLFFELPLVRIFVGLIYIIPSVILMRGTLHNETHFRIWGTWGAFMALVFSTIFRIASVGWTPALWGFTLMLGLISGVIHLYLKAGERNGN